VNNYKLIIQYDGSGYAGWQIQNNAPTLQQKIVDAIEIITREKINLIGSGRTDTGVHAWGQVANFKVEKEINPDSFIYSLNSILPYDIAVKKVETVSESFNARFDAKSRTYIYFFSKNKSPFFKNYSWNNRQLFQIDFKRLNEVSKVLNGIHDFTSLSRKNSTTENKICTISNIWWHKGNELSSFYISADRFLHGMVRTIIGTILYIVKNNLDENHLLEIIGRKDREEAKESVPSKGLFLFKVRY
jgi:tRNA pseudouridine38-40 synthase